ncbi:MAG: exo-alpha-sialidase [Acidimicrobiia bacterium]|nr:exo-alpha-sialidase [Acidimicrobiia bacterium]
MPIFTRKPGQEHWTRETAFWDPDLLIRAEMRGQRQLPSPIHTSESHIVHLPDGSLVSTVSRHPVMADVGPDGALKAADHLIWRSFDRGRTWKVDGKVPGSNFLPFWHPGVQATIRAHLLALPNGNWVASFRHGGMYSSGGGPLVVRKSSDQGKTWSAPKAIRVPGVNPLGLALENGVAVLSYQRPGVFLTFCADGKGDLWSNDVTLVKGWRHQRNENSCANGSFVVTGPDRFIYAYTKWDVPDPWGQPRQAVIAQEFVVSRK